MNLREALTGASTRLSQQPDLATTAARDAELLLLHTLQLPRTILFTDPTRPLSSAEAELFEANVTRRMNLEPIQYITGTQEFFRLAFHVTPAVLIPRPETELLVETVLAMLPADRPLRIVDIGTGSGAIAISIAAQLPQVRMTALDLSAEALAIARENAEAHHVADRIRFLQSDLLAEVAGEAFDAILSNPPYIPTTDRSTLHPEVRDHEPHTALFAGTTGMDIYSRLIPQANEALVPGGLLALEIGYGQLEAIENLLQGWANVTHRKDLQGIPRTVLAHAKRLHPTK
jgi:release factor glutamine methyltransferase